VANVQRVYTKEFKEEAVKLVESSGKSAAQVARDLGVSDSAIYLWQKQLAEKGPDAFPGTGHQSELEEENRRLKRELEITRQERNILKKVVSIFSRKQRCAYQFIEQYKQEFPVVGMCRVLSVSESGYDAWRKRPESQHTREDARLPTQIQHIFVTHRGVYGSPRIHVEIQDLGRRCSRKRIARLRPRKRDGCPAQALSSDNDQKQSQACSRAQSPSAG
jgi:transposase